MNYTQLYAKILEHIATVQALSALGAELRLRQAGLDGDPRVRAVLQTIAAHLTGPDSIDGLEPGQIAIFVGQVTYALQEGLDLIGDPDARPAGAIPIPQFCRSAA